MDVTFNGQTQAHVMIRVFKSCAKQAATQHDTMQLICIMDDEDNSDDSVASLIEWDNGWCLLATEEYYKVLDFATPDVRFEFVRGLATLDKTTICEKTSHSICVSFLELANQIRAIGVKHGDVDWTPKFIRERILLAKTIVTEKLTAEDAETVYPDELWADHNAFSTLHGVLNYLEENCGMNKYTPTNELPKQVFSPFSQPHCLLPVPHLFLSSLDGGDTFGKFAVVWF